uniref:Macaca fascicularis brain cDNA clone: QmoA-10630, similar to human bromodomain adjacent to zinc finger domain, 2B (BAZ2B), mRNA, RefSeq: NM_013450.1 n=1 Tax=Macaca fascicularis TaxID=9541 RepID=I7GE25_MACFA|nr:unnamed protein product [Macaca fascicularis]
MESGERLPSSAASATTPTSSSTPSVASVVSKGGLSTGVASLSSTINPCGHLFRTAGDQPFNLSTVSSAFPMVSHPVFGLHSASSGHSEFGGLGTLGTPTALAAHPQLASFQVQNGGEQPMLIHVQEQPSFHHYWEFHHYLLPQPRIMILLHSIQGLQEKVIEMVPRKE